MSGFGRLTVALVALGLVWGAGCRKKEFTQPIKLADRLDKDGNAIPNSGETLQPAVLNDGYEAYMLYCYGCHGEKGDGNGPSSPTMRPPPRNFAKALFKFPGTGFGQLPVDSALDRTIRRGLHGTPMLPWDIPKKERNALIAYLKTLSPRWVEEGVPQEIEIAKDPWKGRKAEAIELGKQVYHVAAGGAGCSGCHASYETRQDIYAMSLKASPDAPVTEFAEEMYRTALKQSEYPVMRRFGDRLDGCKLKLSEKMSDEELGGLSIQLNGRDVERDTEHKEGWDYVPPPEEKKEGGHGSHHAPKAPVIEFFGKACDELKNDVSWTGPSIVAVKPHQILPPDFLFHKVKSAYDVGDMVYEGDGNWVQYTEEMQREDLYRTIGVGIGGAAMPGWKGVLEEEKLWALVYYVQSLIQMRDKPAAEELRQKLANQPAFVPPAPPAADGGTP